MRLFRLNWFGAPLLMAVGLVTGCGGGDSPSTTVQPEDRLSSLTLTTDVSTLESLGATVQLKATGQMTGGGTVNNPTVSWSSATPEVATVTAGGLVQAVSNGTSLITVASGAISASTTIRVSQLPASVVITEPGDDRVRFFKQGEQERAVAEVLDAGGSLIQGTPPSWRSLDEEVALVDFAGLITANEAGATGVVAYHDGTTASGGEIADTISVEVSHPPVVTITAPVDEARFLQGASVIFQAYWEDLNGGLVGADLVWTSSLMGEIGRGHHLELTQMPLGVHEITLSGTDGIGLVGADTLTVEITAPAPENQVLTGRIDQQASPERDLRGYVVESDAGVFTLAADGSFALEAQELTVPGPIFLVDGEDEIQLFSIYRPEDQNPVELSPRSTAEGLLYLQLAETLTPDSRASFLQFIQGSPAVQTLADRLATILETAPSLSEAPEAVAEAMGEANEALFSGLLPSAAPPREAGGRASGINVSREGTKVRFQVRGVISYGVEVYAGDNLFNGWRLTSEDGRPMTSGYDGESAFVVPGTSFADFSPATGLLWDDDPGEAVLMELPSVVEGLTGYSILIRSGKGVAGDHASHATDAARHGDYWARIRAMPIPVPMSCSRSAVAWLGNRWGAYNVDRTNQDRTIEEDLTWILGTLKEGAVTVGGCLVELAGEALDSVLRLRIKRLLQLNKVYGAVSFMAYDQALRDARSASTPSDKCLLIGGERQDGVMTNQPCMLLEIPEYDFEFLANPKEKLEKQVGAKRVFPGGFRVSPLNPPGGRVRFAHSEQPVPGLEGQAPAGGISAPLQFTKDMGLDQYDYAEVDWFMGVPGDQYLTMQLVDGAGIVYDEKQLQAQSEAKELMITEVPDLIYPVGLTINDPFRATGGYPESGYEWTRVDGTLPTGLSIQSMGALTGAGFKVEKTEFTIQVKSLDGQTATRVLAAEINNDLFIPDPGTISAVLGEALSWPMTAHGGDGANYLWQIAPGITKPNWLSFSASGVFSGTPTQIGDFSTIVRVESGGQVYDRDVDFKVTGQPVVIQPIPSLTGFVGQAFSATLSATGGGGGYTWSLRSGSLPPGVDLSPNGVISGTPGRGGTFNFTVQVMSGSLFETASGSITIRDLITVTPVGTITIPVDQPYSTTLSATGGGGGPYDWSVTNGNPPFGMSLSPTGTISGTPTATGTFPFVVSASAGGETGSANVTIQVVRPAPMIIRSGRHTYDPLVGVPGRVVSPPLEVRITDSAGNPIAGEPVTWSGFGSPRGASWDPRTHWETTGNSNDDPLVVVSDASGYSTVNWQVGSNGCSALGGTTPPMVARLATGESVSFAATYPEDLASQLPPIGPPTITATAVNGGGRWTVYLLIEWTDPLGAGECSGGLNVTMSPSGNRTLGEQSRGKFVITQRVNYSGIGNAPAEVTVTTGINAYLRGAFTHEQTISTTPGG